MIDATVTRGGEAIMRRVYHDPRLTLDAVVKGLEAYIVDEQLNTAGECTIKATIAPASQEAS